MTLEFLGEIQPQSIAEISSVLVEAAKNKQPFILGLEGLGGFPSLKKPHTLWTAVNGNLPELFQLRDDIHQGLLNKGFQLENRPFKPHLTLASRPVLKNIDLSAMQKRKLGSFRVGEVILYDSSVIMGKRTYTRIKTVSFD
ncbi:MAG: RNA 2',3'-cyclic phosphodiesterase [Peptococcaceae bacterium]|nr:RNA 2',3'-cyclic phosphodiesterase [Peptococcaceae bacterium]